MGDKGIGACTGAGVRVTLVCTAAGTNKIVGGRPAGPGTEIIAPGAIIGATTGTGAMMATGIVATLIAGTAVVQTVAGGKKVIIEKNQLNRHVA
jgi:hypothetical protein